MSKNITAKKKFYMEVHDFGFLLPGLDDLMNIKKALPNFKITCFTIPIPKQFFIKDNVQHFKVSKYKQWAKMINDIDWIEIGVHGFAHTKFEMDQNYPNCEILIQAVENWFKQVGLNYKKLFVAPYWQYSYSAFQALKDNGYKVGLDRNHLREVPEGLEIFTYDWSYEESLPDKDIIVGHGHTMSMGVSNCIGSNYAKIINDIPSDAEFGFLSELFDKK